MYEASREHTLQRYRITVEDCQYTVFIGIVAMATINFSLALVQLLIEGGSYSRVAFINIGLISILDGVIQKKL